MGIPFTLLAFAVVILVGVGVHEFGHFLFAKLCNIRVDEFAIGFGPRLFSWGRGETRYSVRALPVGGFVRMAGMLGLPGEGDAGARNFYRASIPKRLLVMVAGIAFNLILAVVLITISVALPTPSQVFAGTPAYAAGLRNGDSILSIDGQAIDHSTLESVSTGITAAVKDSQGRPLTVIYRDSSNAKHIASITPALGVSNGNADNPACDPQHLQQGTNYISAINGMPVPQGDAAALLAKPGTRISGYGLGSPDEGPCQRTPFNNIAMPAASPNLFVSWRLGIQLDFSGAPLNTAVAASAHVLWSFIPSTVDAIRQVSSTPGSGGVFGANGLQGPIGIAQQASTSAQHGLAAALGFIGIISLNLGYLNILPIPFLDGGKIMILLLEAVRGRRMAAQREASIYAIGLAIVIVLMVFITIGNLRQH